jgi:hypothetical protein
MTKTRVATALLLLAAGGAPFQLACTSRDVASDSLTDGSVLGTAADAGGPDALVEGSALTDGGAESAVVTVGIPIGAPCVPAEEYDFTYAGGDVDEVGAQPDDTACNGGVCIIDHFQGRTSCPYGQSADGAPPDGAMSGCMLPDSSTPVQGAVAPWCSNRPPSEVVTCSCRCEDLDGGSDDSGAFCVCPSGYSCTQLIASFGASSGDLAGGYCIKTGSAVGPDAGACIACDPTTTPCP